MIKNIRLTILDEVEPLDDIALIAYLSLLDWNKPNRSTLTKSKPLLHFVVCDHVTSGPQGIPVPPNHFTLQTKEGVDQTTLAYYPGIFLHEFQAWFLGCTRIHLVY
jgi:hypothetical protein